jgi:hypothetical protein
MYNEGRFDDHEDGAVEDRSPAFDGPLSADAPSTLTLDERAAGAAHARVVTLCEALMASPFNRRLNQELRDYLDGEAWEGIEAFERLLELGPDHLTKRLDELAPDLSDGEFQ